METERRPRPKQEIDLIVIRNIQRSDILYADFLQEELHVRSWLNQKRSSGTKRNYEREIKSFFAQFPGLMMRDTKSAHVIAFLTKRAHLSASAQNLSKNTVSSLFRYCVKIGYILKNPVDALDPIRVPEKIAFRSLGANEIERLLAVSQSMRARDCLLIKLLFFTGMRVTEARLLTWASARQQGEQVQLTVIGKGKKVRSVLIDLSFWRELESLREARNAKREDFIFISQKEPYSAISSTQVWRIVKEAVLLSKLPADVSPHWLRHAHATLSLHAGAPISVVQQTLGHSSISTTGRYLVHFPTCSSGEYLGKFK
jgi:site-specific recombinase XerD